MLRIMRRPVQCSFGLTIFLSLSISVWYLVQYDGWQKFNVVLPYFGDLNGYTNFEDKYFRRVLEMFKKFPANSSIEETGNEQENLPVPTFLLVSDLKSDLYWKNQFHHITFNECPLPCNYTMNVTEASNVDAILIHLDSFKNRKSVEKYIKKRDPNIPWVMFTFETPYLANKFVDIQYDDFNFYFNRTMTYRKDADAIVNHGFVVSKENAGLLPYHWRISSGKTSNPVVYKPNTTAVGALISNCKDKSGRLKYIKELQNYINVDIYGNCGSLKCGKPMYVTYKYKPHTEKCLRKVGTQYMFYLAFENSFCKDYGSEKIYNLLYYPIVPIVYGGINYEEILPPNSYINAANYSPVELADYIKYLVSNREEYNSYLKWREYYIPSTIGGERLMCDLCTQLYNPEFYSYNVIQNFTKWYVSDSKCYKYDT